MESVGETSVVHCKSCMASKPDLSHINVESEDDPEMSVAGSDSFAVFTAFVFFSAIHALTTEFWVISSLTEAKSSRLFR